MLIAIALSFLLGAIPFGFLIGKSKGVDIRDAGSGNIGATNAGRVLGKKAGVLTLIIDVIKGAIAVFIAMQIETNPAVWPEQAIPAACGLAAIAGHCFSPFLSFKGGKGVATSLGAFVVLSPVAALTAVITFVVIVKFSGFVSLGSMIAAAALPIAVSMNLGGPYPAAILWASILTAIIVVFKHRTNIERLREGNELRAR